jgi:hypothetical protein
VGPIENFLPLGPATGWENRAELREYQNIFFAPTIKDVPVPQWLLKNMEIAK